MHKNNAPNQKTKSAFLKKLKNQKTTLTLTLGQIMKGIKISKLKKRNGKYAYHGKLFSLNKPTVSTSKNKKMMVLASKTVHGEKRAKLIHFGARGYGHNYSPQAKKNYLKRSAGIRNKQGHLTKNDPWSANYWARKILWPAHKPTTGPRTTKKR